MAWVEGTDPSRPPRLAPSGRTTAPTRVTAGESSRRPTGHATDPTHAQALGAGSQRERDHGRGVLGLPPARPGGRAGPECEVRAAPECRGPARAGRRPDRRRVRRVVGAGLLREAPAA